MLAINHLRSYGLARLDDELPDLLLREAGQDQQVANMIGKCKCRFTPEPVGTERFRSPANLMGWQKNPLN
jgi:hypothetical protein